MHTFHSHDSLSLCVLIPLLGAIAGSGGYTENLKPLYMDRVTCGGSEESLFNCNFASADTSSCRQTSDAGVVCQGIDCSGTLFQDPPS